MYSISDSISEGPSRRTGLDRLGQRGQRDDRLRRKTWLSRHRINPGDLRNGHRRHFAPGQAGKGLILPEVVLGMLFLTLSSADIRFAEKELIWRTYTAAEALSSWSKCQFRQEEVCFLGYVVSSQGVLTYSFANFYRHFIQGFSKIAAPLTLMLRTSSSTDSSTSAAQIVVEDRVDGGGGGGGTSVKKSSKVKGHHFGET